LIEMPNFNGAGVVIPNWLIATLPLTGCDIAPWLRECLNECDAARQQRQAPPAAPGATSERIESAAIGDVFLSRRGT
jgi:hypothetical protein